MKDIKEKEFIFDRIFLIIFCTLILTFGILIFLLTPKSFSEKENRPLAKLPTADIESIIDGRYFKELSNFFADQFPARDFFTATYSAVELSMGKMEVNNVMIANDKKLIAIPKEYPFDTLEKNFNFICGLTKNVFFYVPPRSIDYYKEKLPPTYNYSKHEKELAFLKNDTLENFKELVHQGSDLYYKTDHHWTTDGAYFAYTQICDNMGITAFGKNFFQVACVSNEFRGTSASKSGLSENMIPADKILLYRYDGDTEYTVINHETNTKSNGFYSFDALNAKDKYKIFLGGNYSHISVINENTSKEKLLLIKDSFANPVIPFLALHFDIEIVDPRYCKTGFLREQIEREDIDRILILMGLDTLSENIFTK